MAKRKISYDALIYQRVPSDLERRFTQFAIQTGRNRADVLREALTRYLDARQNENAPTAGKQNSNTVQIG